MGPLDESIPLKINESLIAFDHRLIRVDVNALRRAFGGVPVSPSSGPGETSVWKRESCMWGIRHVSS